MLFNIPQFIDKEDKIVGPLTARQLGWLIGGAVVIFVFWTFLVKPVFIVVAVIVGGITGALAFYQPNGQPLISFLLSSFSFLSSPKMYVWKRVQEKEIERKMTTATVAMNIPKKAVSSERIEELSKILDNRQ